MNMRDFIQMTHKFYFKNGPEIWHIIIFELLAKDAWGFKVPKAFLYFFIWVVSNMRLDHRMGLIHGTFTSVMIINVCTIKHDTN